MKIELGEIFNSYDPPDMGIYIPGLGVIKANKPAEGFPYVQLSLKQMIKLKKELEILIDEQETNV